jgi:predicted house-cleaning noncanonical NTP pyrophosphatase (MazG superfamily)
MYNEYKSGNYKSTYSKKSQQAIEEFFQSKNFEESDINDAVILQDRIKNLEKIKNIIHENPEYVAAYKQALQQNRTMQLIGSHIVNQV